MPLWGWNSQIDRRIVRQACLGATDGSFSKKSGRVGRGQCRRFLCCQNRRRRPSSTLWYGRGRGRGQIRSVARRECVEVEGVYESVVVEVAGAVAENIFIEVHRQSVESQRIDVAIVVRVGGDKEELVERR